MKFPKNFLAACVAAGAMTLPAIAAESNQPRALLRDLVYNAQVAERDAGRLNSYSADNLDWQAQGLELNNLKAEVNHMSSTVQRLQSQPLSPGQQRLVDRVARRVNMIASDTQDAILTGNAHRDYLWDRTYQRDVHRIYSNSETLNRVAKDALRLNESNESGQADE